METYKKNKELMYEHNKTLCNTNMNYFFLYFHTLSKTKHQQRAMRIHQQFPITIMKV
jgi:hypothetical protein